MANRRVRRKEEMGPKAKVPAAVWIMASPWLLLCLALALSLLPVSILGMFIWLPTWMPSSICRGSSCLNNTMDMAIKMIRLPYDAFDWLTCYTCAESPDVPFHNSKHDDSPPAHYVISMPPLPSLPAPAPLSPLPPSVISSTPKSPSATFGSSTSSFTYDELAKATNNFSKSNFLGEGGFGYVHKGVINGKEVAIKQLKTESKQGEREFQAEIEVISSVHHRHLVKLIGYCMTNGNRILVYEYVPNGALGFHLHGRTPTVDWPTRLKVSLGSAKGLAYLHEDCQPAIIHRDVKAANILLDHSFEAKVADFGLARFFPDDQTHVSTRVVGTFGYLAPEYASTGRLTDKSDVFSFGVMLLELITGRRSVFQTSSNEIEGLVNWARPLLTQAQDKGYYEPLVDPQLGKSYNVEQMRRMVACATACIRNSARQRPRMSQIVRALEGLLPLEDLRGAVSLESYPFSTGSDVSEFQSGTDSSGPSGGVQSES